MAKPVWLHTRFPRVVSTERIASIASSTSWLFIVAMPTGEPMNGTGSWGRVGASGQICVATMTSPGNRGPDEWMFPG